MNAVDRKERALAICRRVADAVSAVAPPGLGRWDGAWERVEAPSGAFLDALDTWERSGAPEDQRAVQRTAEAVLAAWKESAEAWERAGRPGAREAGTREVARAAR